MRQLRRERGVRRWKRGRRKPTGIDLWLAGRKRVFVFLVIFGLLMAGFYAFIGFVPVYNHKILPAYHRFIASASSEILSYLGENATVVDVSIISPRFSVRVIRGCDAVEATGLFMCAILAFPAGLVQKFAGIIIGAFALAVLNFVRIVSLFLIGIHLPRMVDFMHIEVWQGLFIIFAVILWVFWLLWTTRNSFHIKTTSPAGPVSS